MKLQFRNQHILYYLLCILFIMVFIAKIGTFHIEAIDLGFLKQILHPEYPIGPLPYDPQFHYNYIVAFFARLFGYEASAPELAGIFWFLEQAFTLLVLVKLCDFLFKDDRLTLILVIFIYLMLKSGETDQKTMLRPLHFLAIYYFLKENWLLAAIFSASIFYIHIGVALWWFIPSCFALCLVYLFKNRQVNIFQIMIYASIVTIMASPILYYYIASVGIEQSFTKNEFFKNYWYGTVNNSVLYELIYSPKALILILINVGVFTVGYMKWKNNGGRNNYILPIGLGVLILYVLDFVLVDVMFNGTAMKMQFLRSKLNIEFFVSLFFPFLIVRQIRRGNYVFFSLLLILLILYPFWSVLNSFIYRSDALIVLYAFVVTYEIFEGKFSRSREKIKSFFSRRLVVLRLPKITYKTHDFFQNPVNFVSFFVVIIALQATLLLSPIKPYVKSVLGIQQKTGMSKSESLFQDITRFTNEKIPGEKVYIVFPFGKGDFKYYTNQKVFISEMTMLEYSPSHIRQFENIFKNDLNYTIEELKNGGSWNEIWRSVDEKLIRKWIKEYSITHVIRENELPLDFPIAYENEHYTIYDLRLLNNFQEGIKT